MTQTTRIVRHHLTFHYSNRVITFESVKNPLDKIYYLERKGHFKRWLFLEVTSLSDQSTKLFYRSDFWLSERQITYNSQQMEIMQIKLSTKTKMNLQRYCEKHSIKPAYHLQNIITLSLRSSG